MRFTLNGAPADVDAFPGKRLLDVLREECGLTGTKEGCGEGECGACTVLMDGELVVSCLVPFAQAEDATIVTIEGLGKDHDLQHHFMNEAGAQCGICTPGMVMVASQLPPNATLDEIKVALAGNLCRCTGYEAIYRAIQRAQGTATE
ncbi:MAG: (2Fe-2S)-binding protein [Gemmatimonadota bacterium]|nr:(2Fe-2S)-binding protein [Gemmatimonadota bacterium]